jgi:hypothetical protein
MILLASHSPCGTFEKLRWLCNCLLDELNLWNEVPP